MLRFVRRCCVRCVLFIFLSGLASNSYGITYTEAVFNDNPLGYWAFQDGPTGSADGQTAINFGTGQDLDGSYVGGSRVDAQLLQLADGRVADLGDTNLAFAVGFEGTDEYMTVPQSLLSGRSAFTMTGWVNPGPRDANRIGLFGQNDVIEFGFITPNLINLWNPIGQVADYNIEPDVVQENTWFHIGVVGTGQGTQIFINGEKVAGIDGDAGYGASSFGFNIGGGGVFDATGNQFTGTIDEVTVYNKALTDEQILIQALSPETYSDVVLSSDPETGIGVLPIGYWGFEDDGSVAVNRGTSGALLDGEYVGVTPSTGGPGGAFPLENQFIDVSAAAGDGYVTVDASPLSALREFTVSGWIAPGDQMGNTRVGLFGQNDAIEFGLINPDTLQIWTPRGGALDVPITGEINPDEWNHVAAVGTGEELRFFINGEFVGSGGAPLPVGGVDTYGESGDPFNVGGGGVWDASGNQFTGIIDEVAVWDSALTEAQVRAQFQSAFADVVNVPGDADGDGQVDASDLNILGVNWQQEVANGIAGGDFDESGFVDAADLNILGTNWQFGVGEAPLNASVPEPGSRALILMFLLLGPVVRRFVRSKS